MVKVKNVSKTFHNKDGSKVRALRNIDIDFDENGITFISGESGNGKSTLLSILAGLTRFDSGDILVDGVSFKTFTTKDFDAYWRNYIGFVFEDFNLIETLNVRENIKLGVLADGRVPSEEQIAAVLKKVKLSGFEDRLVAQLSSGQRQRVCIARTLIKHPRILFMDEPTAHLDDKNKILIWDMVKEISKDCLVLSVSHDSHMVEKYADRVITLEDNTVKKDVRKNKKTSKKEESVEKPAKKAPVKKEEHLHTKRNKKHGLSFKYSFRMALNSLLFRRWRTVFMVIICTFAVSFFGLFTVLGSYNTTYAQANALFNSDGTSLAPYVIFNKNTSEYSAIQSYDMERVESILGTGEDAIKYTEFARTNNQITFNEDPSIRKMTDFHRDLTITGIIKADSTDVKITPNDQNIIYGKYPRTATEGIVISDYMLGLIKLYGLPKGIGTAWEDEEPLRAETRIDDNDDPSNVWGKTYIEENVIGHSITIDNASFKIAGVYSTNFRDYVLETSMGYYNSTVPKELYNYSLNKIYMVIQVPADFSDNLVTTGVAINIGDFANNKEGLQNIIKEFGRKGFALNSVTSETVKQMNKSVEIYKNVVIILGVYSAVFAIIMMYYFINQIIHDRKRDVGVLKALGFSNLDISTIFLQSTGMFVMFSFLVTLIVTSIASAIANKVASGIAFIKFDIMSINFSVIGIMFAVSLVIAILGMIIPLVKFAKKKPNEILKGFR